MHRARSSPTWSAAAVIALGIASCRSTSGEEGAPGRPTSSRIAFAETWAGAIHDMGMFPVFPPTEDVYVGDVYAFSAPPIFASTRTADGLRIAATPRWMSLQVLAPLEEEYRSRPTWGGSDAAASATAQGGASPVRHRVVGLRSMLKVTLGVADLEPYIPIEVAPLIKGPATPERFAASVQAGDSETYSLSVDAMIGQLFDVAEGPEGPRFTLKPEHLAHLTLAADPQTGKAYLMAVTQVLYVRSVEANIRKREQAEVEAAEEAEQPSRHRRTETEEPSEPAAPAPAAPSQPDAEDAATAAIERARAMNEAFAEAGIQGPSGEALQVVMATEQAITLRRTWPYPLAVAIRGITVEIDATTGDVLRMGPLGIELPKLPPPPKPAPEPEPEANPEAGEPQPGQGP